MPELALRANFRVIVDQFVLGSWATCEGLRASYNIKQYEEGGQNGFVHQRVGRLTYSNITLTRAVSVESMQMAAWFASYQAQVVRATAKIMVADPAGTEIVVWNLMGVVPVSWSASQFDANASGVLTETLELAHEGFF